MKRSAIGFLGAAFLLLGIMAARPDILREYWTGIGGTAVADLTGNPNYPDHPTGSNLLSSFEAPTDWADSYGTRVRGYITAPATGSYVFWIASDDNGELWLSTDVDPDNRVLIASVPDWTGSREWNKFPVQKSASIPLVQGTRYYVEALQKEGVGGDNLAVGWSKPGESTAVPSEVVPGAVLSPWAGPDPAVNARPVITAPGDISSAVTPASLQITATVSDDGKPLPANPANPDPTDPNKLRWHWTVVSAPAASAGVGWSGHATNGEAFTYAGSANAPGTVFTCDPTATFDVPGFYILEFRAGDGAKEASKQAWVSIGLNENYHDAGYMYLSPLPRAEYTPTGTEYVLVRFSNALPNDLSNLTSFISVRGASTGLHTGQTRVASDGRTLLFEMASGFAAGERVAVSLNPALRPGTPGTVAPYQYQFMVQTHFPDPDPITARGEVLPAGAKTNAFDGNILTKWVDLIVPDGTQHFSWIQSLYRGLNEAHALDEYALTSASDSPEDDPADWRFYGVDSSNHLALLDIQTNQLFSARGERKSYAITNLTAYRGYRLEITRVRDPGTALGVQLAELEFMQHAALLWEYWLNIPGNAVSDLTGNANYPNNPSGSNQLSSFEAPINWAYNYGARARGYLTAPSTGTFFFWIASDDNSELWLSTDQTTNNKSLIASVPVWTNPREWTKYSQQKSAGITLTAGQKYYIEALQKQGGGGDNLAVGWAKPGQGTSTASEVIPGEVLSTWRPGGVVLTLRGATTPSADGPANEAPGLTPQDAIVNSASITSNGVSIPSDFPAVSVTINRNPSPGYIFISYPHDNSAQRYVMILDNNGNPVWYKRGGPDAWNEFKIQKNGTLTMEIFNAYDNNLNWIRSYQARNGHVINHHDLKVFADGGYLVIADNTLNVDASRLVAGGNPNASVTQTIIQEYTAADDLIFQYRAWDNYDVADLQLDNNLASSFRFPHINGTDIDEDGNIVISCRHLSEVTKIDRNTGEKIWRLGGAHNDFTFVNDPLNGFYNQHNITALGHNHYLLFDNGDGHNPQVSRAVEYQLDVTNKTATLVWQFRDTPDKYAYYMGNAQRLPNGNTLINFVLAQYPKIIEVDPQGVKQFELSILPGSDLYRGFRFPWNGVIAVPYLIAESFPDNVTLIFNKFGDTNVSYYRIYGGTSPQPTTLLATTPFTLARLSNLTNNQQYYFRVTAVAGNGTESGYSNEENVMVNLVQPGQNMVQNGNFSSGTNAWTWAANNTGAGTFSVVTGACLIHITSPGTALTDLQLRQSGLKLVQGKQYVLEFDGSAVGGTHAIDVKLGQDQSPFGIYYTTSPTLRTTPQHFTFSFTMTSATDLNARLMFNMGGLARDVVLDNISLYMAYDSQVTVTLATLPAHLAVTVDGTNYTAPASFTWPTNSSHTLSAADAQLSGDGHIRYPFLSWSDGGAKTHILTTPLWQTNYTASFSMQYLMDITLAPVGGGSVTAMPSGPWYPPNQTVSLTANPSPGFNFLSWSGVDSQADNTALTTMSGYRDVTATFQAVGPISIDRQSLTRLPDGRIQFGITAPGITATVLGSTNLLNWHILQMLNLTNGAAVFTDNTATNFPYQFYRLQVP